jgi:hypothetical protein
MQTHHSRIGRRYRASLKAIKGFKKDTPALAALSRTAWLFASSIRWNSTHVSTIEIEASKEKIKEYLRLSRDPRKAFLAFCQRIVLAQGPFADDQGNCLFLPSAWLDRRNKAGFAATKPAYDEIKKVRASLPQYYRELKALAEAVLEFSEEPTQKNFQYWKSYFRERKVPGLLELFQVYAINFLYTI